MFLPALRSMMKMRNLEELFETRENFICIRESNKASKRKSVKLLKPSEASNVEIIFKMTLQSNPH